MSAAATSEHGLLLSTHAFEQDIPPSIADGVAGLLRVDRQIIVVTGKLDGRMGGFLADLTHSISKRGSLLRIKSALTADEFHAALAGQLHLPPRNETPVELAARIGRRLQQAAPKGRFALLCEGADQYELATLEAIRQLSNYPVSIVLVGGHSLTRRLRRRSLAPLRQRITHQLALNRRSLFTTLFWIGLIVLVAGGALTYLLSPTQHTEDVAPPRPISVKAAPPALAPAPVVVTPPAPELPASAPELQLVLEQELSVRPRTTDKALPHP
jgi:hypothetical protein